MALIADLILVAAALAAGFYCFVLSRRLAAFKDAESGIGSVVSALSAQVDELSNSVTAARKAANASSGSLSELTARAEDVAQRLELMVASMHDIPDETSQAPASKPVEKPVFSSRVGRAAGK